MNFFKEEIKNLTVKNLRQDKNDWLIDIEFTISNGIDTYKGTIKKYYPVLYWQPHRIRNHGADN